MAGKVLYAKSKSEKRSLVSRMENDGYFLASCKGRTIEGQSLLMLTFYENGLKASQSQSE
jgi:hypothetical protein